MFQHLALKPADVKDLPRSYAAPNTLSDKLESIQERASRIITQSGHIQLKMDSLETLNYSRTSIKRPPLGNDQVTA